MKADYFQAANSPPHRLRVAKTREDGTVDLADENASVLVESCPVAELPTSAACVLVADQDEESAPPAKKKKNSAE